MGLISSPGRGKNYLHFTSSTPALRPTETPIQSVMGAFPSGVKRPACETVTSPPACVEITKSGSIHSLPYTSSWCSA
jgi:hypothetical protein